MVGQHYINLHDHQDEIIMAHDIYVQLFFIINSFLNTLCLYFQIMFFIYYENSISLCVLRSADIILFVVKPNKVFVRI